MKRILIGGVLAAMLAAIALAWPPGECATDAECLALCSLGSDCDGGPQP